MAQDSATPAPCGKKQKKAEDAVPKALRDVMATLITAVEKAAKKEEDAAKKAARKAAEKQAASELKAAEKEQRMLKVADEERRRAEERAAAAAAAAAEKEARRTPLSAEHRRCYSLTRGCDRLAAGGGGGLLADGRGAACTASMLAGTTTYTRRGLAMWDAAAYMQATFHSAYGDASELELPQSQQIRAAKTMRKLTLCACPLAVLLVS